MHDDAAGGAPWDPTRMHEYRDETDTLARAVIDYALTRVRMSPPDLDGPVPLRTLVERVGETITDDGLGEQALRIWIDELAPACISQDHPRMLSFVPSAPAKAAVLFDMVVGASAIYAGSWLEGAGAVHAENQALRYVADLAGLPPEAGGAFVAGGTAGNLSALVTARWKASQQRGGRPERWKVVASAEAHASVAASAQVMDVDVVDVPTDERGRMTGAALEGVLADLDARDVFAVVATAGTTNAGMVDDLAGIAEACRRHDIWMHVDGAYGGAAMAAPSARGLFDGIEATDSLVVDPHKWLFAPFDCAALVYRDPRLARAALTQRAAYLDVYNEPHEWNEWNPSDYAHHLSRRARGLPFWFALAVHGRRAFAEAVEQTLATTRAAVALIGERDHLALVMEPMLSVVMFRRLGWQTVDYRRWADELLAAGAGLVVPSRWRYQPVMRFCVVNPRTTPDDLAFLLDAMR
ncbi:MAG: aminotransferase class V-fold PLP-dependent enzyme [Acidimicrobiales bacterium]|nr:aminotransferase class V-fold PLP-dependent enzyme [Acidimicrobiales bacterium]